MTAVEKSVSVGVHKKVKVLPVPMYVVEFDDLEGKQTRLAIIIGGTEVRFLREDAVSNPAAAWLANDILIAAGMQDPAQKKV